MRKKLKTTKRLESEDCLVLVNLTWKTIFNDTNYLVQVTKFMNNLYNMINGEMKQTEKVVKTITNEFFICVTIFVIPVTESFFVVLIFLFLITFKTLPVCQRI